jgi:hypothetical protein
VDETKDKMVAGEAALALVWSGDAQYAIDLNPTWLRVCPMKAAKSGWTHGDPQGCQKQENARSSLDFMCRRISPP